MREQSHLADNALRRLDGIPDIKEDVMQIRPIGAAPTYHGPTPPLGRIRGFPHNPRDAHLAMGGLWGCAQSGKMFVCARARLPINDVLSTSPSTTVAKKFPDRTASAGKRLIWGGRRVNIHCPKYDYWHLDTPDIQELAIWSTQIRAEYPGLEVVGEKRGVDASFTRCRIRPADSMMFATEFPTEHYESDNIIFMYMIPLSVLQARRAFPVGL